MCIRDRLGRVVVLRHDAAVRHRLNPRRFWQHVTERTLGRLWLREIHGTRTTLRPAEHVQTDVCGDSIEPRTHSRPAIEPIKPPPCPYNRLLHSVLRLERRPEYPVAITGQLFSV